MAKQRNDTSRASAHGSIRDAAASQRFKSELAVVRKQAPVANATLTNGNSNPTYIVMINDRPFEVSVEMVKLAKEAVERAVEIAQSCYSKLSPQTQRAISDIDRKLVGIESKGRGRRRR